ncbi:MAG: polyprenyl synthetase family protein [Deltaproteobacteria bacterium]|nr:polyprenyl synthetase family protein [Deltaproteobacteria bacterium]
MEQKLAECTRSREAEITEIASHLIQSGGKRIRPVITLLTFSAFRGERQEDAVDIAAAMELIHAATLLHDDIIDGAEFRRGKVSAYKRYGLARTLVAGDFLFIKAFEFAGKFDDTVVQWTADACTSLTEGEILQGSFNRNRTVTAKDYLDIVERKTASLFQTGARLGAYIAGANAEQVEAAANFGLNLGIAFQMMDDVLDVVGRRKLLGKSTGMDLRDGNPSLPIVLSLLDGHQTVSRVFQSPTPTENDIRRALDAMGNGTVIERARSFAHKYALMASREIERLPQSDARDGLKVLGRLLTDRDS